MCSTPKPELTSIVPLGPADPLVGRVLCDDIVPIYGDELKEDLGALSRETMAAVAAGLSSALGLA